MEFKLNEYHQGVTDEELLNDVKRVSELVGDVYISTSLYKQHGKYGGTTFIKRFGSWLNVLEKLGLRTERNSTEMKRISDKALVKDLLRVAELLDKKIVTSTEYYEHGKYSAPTITERFGAWANFVDKAGLEQTGFIRKIEDEELFTEIERIWTTLGKQPTTTDMKKGISKYSLDSFTRRFGGWRNALSAFIEYVKSDDDNFASDNNDSTNAEVVEVLVEEIEVTKPIKLKPKRTPRNINLKLRFKVLVRDNFRCCYCGASPAKDPNVILHVDHILPWSKGGETVLENLQAACSTCNLGKNNLVHD